MTHDNIDILVVDDDISHCTICGLLRGWGTITSRWQTTGDRRWSRCRNRS